MVKSFQHGTYTPLHMNKYKGTFPIIYRSSYELKFMRWCDTNEHIIAWGSESNIIPYYDSNQKKVRKYFVDNFLVLNKQNKLYKYLIEIKPNCQTTPPVNKKYKKHSTILYEQLMYVNNQEKWSAAKEWCNKHGYTFMVLTEIELSKLLGGK